MLSSGGNSFQFLVFLVLTDFVVVAITSPEDRILNYPEGEEATKSVSNNSF
jgi:hypothetical protein